MSPIKTQHFAQSGTRFVIVLFFSVLVSITGVNAQAPIVVQITDAMPGDIIAAINNSNNNRSTPYILELADGGNYDLVTVAPNAPDDTAFPEILGDVTIVTNGTPAIINRNGVPEFRFFVVRSGGRLQLDNVHLVNGLVRSAPDEYARGGAIFNEGSLTLNRVSFENNSVIKQGNFLSNLFDRSTIAIAQGGAIYNEGTITEITDSSFTQNSAIGGSYAAIAVGSRSRSQGGAIYNAGVIETIQSVDLSTTFNANFVDVGAIGLAHLTLGEGGAIYNAANSLLGEIIGTDALPVVFEGNLVIGSTGLAFGSNNHGGAIFNGGQINRVLYTHFIGNRVIDLNLHFAAGYYPISVYGILVITNDLINIIDLFFPGNIVLQVIGFITTGVEAFCITGQNIFEICSDSLIDPIDVGANSDGGAIYNAANISRIDNSMFISNEVLGGRGLFYNGGYGRGGAIYQTTTGVLLTISNTEFITNTASGGYGSGNGGYAFGGAIFNDGTLTSIRQTTFSGNYADAGKGARSTQDIFTDIVGLVGNLISNPSIPGIIALLEPLFAFNGTNGSASGGAIYISEVGQLTSINATDFSGNYAYGDLGFKTRTNQGGAIANESLTQLTIIDSNFTSNYVNSGIALNTGGNAYGGGIYHSNGLLILRNTNFTENYAQGGNSYQMNDFLGIALGSVLSDIINSPIAPGTRKFIIKNYIRTFVTPVIRNVGGGGGLYIENGEVRIIDSTFDNNTSLGGFTVTGGIGRGGAIQINNGELILLRSDILNNQSIGGTGLVGGDAWGGGLYNLSGEITISETTFQGNTARGGGIDIEDVFAELEDFTSTYVTLAIVTNVFPTDWITTTFNVNVDEILQTFVDAAALAEDFLVTNLSGFAVFGGDAYGGAIYNRGGSIIVRNGTFSFNQAEAGFGQTLLYGGRSYGGAIYNHSKIDLNLPPIQIQGITLPFNIVLDADIELEGADVSAEMRIFDTSINNNTALNTASNFASGGGIFNAGTMRVSRSNIAENRADVLYTSAFPLFPCGARGGGIVNEFGGQMTIDSTSIVNNAVTVEDVTPCEGRGGGVFSDLGGVFIGRTYVDRVVLSAIADFDFGILPESRLTMTNVTISGNNVLNGIGGGIYNADVMQVNHATIVENLANDGVALFNAGDFIIKNSILNGETNAQCVNQNGSFSGEGFNLNTDTTCSGLSNTFSTVTSLQIEDLNLNSPGTTLTHALIPNSAAIDATTNCNSIAGLRIGIDQRSIRRDARCDLGAYEIETNLPEGNGSSSVGASISISKIGFLTADDFSSATWSIVISNNSDVAVSNLLLSDVVPDGQTIIAATSSHGIVSYDETSLELVIPVLNPGDYIQIVIDVNLLVDGTVTNIACIIFDDGSVPICAEGVLIQVLPRTGESRQNSFLFWSAIISMSISCSAAWIVWKQCTSGAR